MLRFAAGRLCLIAAVVAPALSSLGGWIAADEAVLAIQKQKHIWDLEHGSFLLETYFGKPFAAAIRHGQRERLAVTFTEDFKGLVLASGAGRTRGASLVTEVRRDASSSEVRAVDAAGYVDLLVGYLSEFETISRIRVHVLDIQTEDARPGAWDVLLLLAAAGRGSDGSLLEHVSKHRAEFHFDSEEALKRGERILAGLQVVSESGRSCPRPLMQEVTEQVGLADLPLPDNWNLPTHLIRTHRYQFAVDDYDLDGYPDIAVSATNGRPLLLHSSRGQRFDDVTGSVGLRPAVDTPQEKMRNALAGWIDYDNDGYPDLVLGERLYHNVAGKRFEDVTKASGLKLDKSPFGTVVADYDGDGLLDLYIVNQSGFRRRPQGKRPWVGDPYAGTQNHLWRNEGGGKFRNVTTMSSAGGGWHQTFAAANFFLDDDPYPDLYLANDFGTNVMLRNKGDGTFEDVTTRYGTGDFSTSMGVSAGDLDNDGRAELYVANMYSKMGRRIVAHIDPGDYPEGLYEKIIGSLAGNRLYRLDSDGNGSEELSKQLGINAVGWAFAPTMVDLDGDGWLDLYAAAGFNSADPDKPDG